MIQVRIFLSFGFCFTGSASSISNSRHKDITVLLLLVGTTSCKTKIIGVNIQGATTVTLIWIVTLLTIFTKEIIKNYFAVLAQHPEGWRQEPVEEVQQKGAIFWALERLGKSVYPGDYQRFPSQLRWFHEDHTAATDCGRLQLVGGKGIQTIRDIKLKNKCFVLLFLTIQCKK